VKVEMAVAGLEFELKITDNGKGFEVPPLSTVNNNPRAGRGGNGLKNMRQRLTTLGGECLVSSRTGAGTIVTIRLRLNKKNTGQP
jgi:signal transduction histidine kinase